MGDETVDPVVPVQIPADARQYSRAGEIYRVMRANIGSAVAITATNGRTLHRIRSASLGNYNRRAAADGFRVRTKITEDKLYLWLEKRA